MRPNTPKIIPSGEIYIGNIIQAYRASVEYLFERRLRIVFLSLLGGLGGLLWAHYSVPVYRAKTTFVFKEDAYSGVLSGLSGIGTMLGINANGSGANSLDRIIDLCGSHLIIGQALLTPVKINRRHDLLINHFLRIHEVRNRRKWSRDTLLAQSSFDLACTYESLNKSQRHALNEVIFELRGRDVKPKGIINLKYDKKSSIITLLIEETDEELALNLNKILFDKLVNFYTQQSVSTLANRVVKLQSKVDSIYLLLNATQSASAQTSDQGMGLMLQSDRLRQKRLYVRENMLIVMYGEAVKNLEQLNFLLTTSTPTFSVIDQTYPPIVPPTKNKLLYSALFLLMTSIGFMFILLLQFFFVNLFKRFTP